LEAHLLPLQDIKLAASLKPCLPVKVVIGVGTITKERKTLLKARAREEHRVSHDRLCQVPDSQAFRHCKGVAEHSAQLEGEKQLGWRTAKILDLCGQRASMLQTLPRALSKDDCIGHRQRRHGRDHADGGLLLAAKQASFSLLATKTGNCKCV